MVVLSDITRQDFPIRGRKRCSFDLVLVNRRTHNSVNDYFATGRWYHKAMLEMGHVFSAHVTNHSLTTGCFESQRPPSPKTDTRPLVEALRVGV